MPSKSVSTPRKTKAEPATVTRKGKVGKTGKYTLTLTIGEATINGVPIPTTQAASWIADKAEETLKKWAESDSV